MQILILLLIAFLIYIFVVPLAAAARSKDALRRVESLEGKLREALRQIGELRDRMKGMESDKVREKFMLPPARVRATVEESAVVEPTTQAGQTQKELETVVHEETHVATPAPPPIPPSLALPVVPTPLPKVPVVARLEASTPPQRIAPEPGKETQRLNLEQFLGVKLFAWLGGLALFFGIAFFVKYSFEHNLIPPSMRVAIGFLLGAGLLVSGVVIHRREAYTVLAQTFCASGTLILYGVTFAGHSIYELFGAGSQGSMVAFGIMALVTAVAFLLAVRLNALVVAILGMAGGFLTPILCSTGQDHPFGLFGYIALLDIGLLMVAKHRRWFFLASMGAAGTLLMQVGWFNRFFDSGHYYEGSATLIPMGIFIAFVILFTLAAWRTMLTEKEDPHPLWAALMLCGLGLAFSFVFLNYDGITSRVFLLYIYVFIINIAALFIVVIAPQFYSVQLIAAGLTFAHLGFWTMNFLTTELLGSALAVYLIFGILHAAFPVVWRKFSSADVGVSRLFSPWIPPLVLVLILLPIFRLPEVSFLIWPAVLLIDLCVIATAIVSGLLLPVFAALALTLLVLGSWLLRSPVDISMELPFLLLLGGFAALFATAGGWLAKRFAANAETADPQTKFMIGALPVCSAAMPFLLLIMAVARLPLANPSPVFGLGTLLVILLLGIAKLTRVTVLCVASLVCMLALEFCWLDARFNPEQPWIPLSWFVGMHLLFSIFPFCFRETFKSSILPWAASALSGIGHFLLVYQIVKLSFPQMASVMGLLPAIFVIPGLIGLVGVVRMVKSEGPSRHGQLAWFGGVVLFFITLIFPIQFDRQWLTLGWALEGAALIWLFHRAPHRGLIYTGLVLLVISFLRLSINPAVLEYYPRGDTPILNWHLYTYSIAAVSMMLGARWLVAPNHRLGEVNMSAVLWAMGGILVFLLLNIEIADFFTEPGHRFITISFGGSNFARDMTYSIAWGVFALILLILGIFIKSKGVRYAGVGLLGATLLKLFFHDLASLSSIYRIGALLVVAVIALLASFLYQRFLSKTNE